MNPSILTLCGGVGGAKLAYGLSRTANPDDLLVVVNTGDDFLHLGLHISPDLDTVMYTLAGASDTERGWGLAGETWNFMEAIARFEGADWFRLGDRDLATHLYRTRALQQGLGLAEVTKSLCDAFGIAHRVLPMTDDPLQTVIVTDQGDLPFQDYFVRLDCRPRVRSVRFNWVEMARPHPEFAALLNNRELRAVILCPSNPFLSIDPILSLEGVRPGLQSTPAPVVAVSPIIGGKALKGPAARIMEELGMEPGNPAIAEYYRDFLDGLIIDRADEHEAPAIEKLGVRVKIADTVMRSMQDRIDLAETTLEFALGF
jgi:LPPG:FO 2-phospho-L-lactate transferase